MVVTTGQIYKDNDRRLEGRTLKVVEFDGYRAEMEILTNPNDVQSLLDDPSGTPGTRGYAPKDRRGKTTKIQGSSLTSHRFSLVASE